jgi:hypothetical protein
MWATLGRTDEKPTEQVSKTWERGLESTTNTLAALLKVPLGFDPAFDTRIKRTSLGESKRLDLARDLLALSSGLLAEFDAASPR